MNEVTRILSAIERGDPHAATGRSPAPGCGNSFPK
jgi:hypothetical protein